MDNFINQAILWLQLNISAESLTIWLFLVCAIAIFGLLRFYGAFGLYVYNALAIVIANIQVLCFTQYSVFTDPVAQGTILFTTTFFVNDVLTEHYGVEYAKKSIMLGFWAQLLVTAFMLLTLSHPLPSLTNDPLLQEGNLNYAAMQRLFTPSVRILLASLISYVCSQCLDIYIFNWLRVKTTGKFLWLRQNVAMLASGIFDTCLFSILAWMVFSNTPITWHELFFNYIISSQIMRFILNFSFTPLMYVSNFCVPKRTVSVFDLKERAASS